MQLGPDYIQDTQAMVILGECNIHTSQTWRSRPTPGTLKEASQRMRHLCLGLALWALEGEQTSRHTPNLRSAAEQTQVTPVISICSISACPSVQGSLQRQETRGEKNLSKLITWVCVFVQSCRLRKEKQFSHLPLLLGIWLATWHSAWLSLTEAWHISYRRNKKLVNWWQFLYVKPNTKQWAKRPPQWVFMYICAAYVQVHVYIILQESCKPKHGENSMV